MEQPHQQRSFIFGSFSRRNDNNIEKKLVRNEQSPSIKSNNSVNAGWMVDATTLKCSQCQKYFNEPRLLPCLHTFCLKCLESLEQAECEESAAVSSTENLSVYKAITCPLCNTTSEIPPEGVVALPFNYTVQHKIVLAALNDTNTKLLCDICPDEILAVSRCTKCAINLCDLCTKKHTRISNLDHEVLDLHEARRRGITRVRRQIMCTQHPTEQLTTYCLNCTQVICDACGSATHKTHTVKPVQKAAKIYTKNIQTSIEQTKTIFHNLSDSMVQLEKSTKLIDDQCNKMHEDIETFIANYQKSIQQHHEMLLAQLEELKSSRMKLLECKRLGIERNVKDSIECIKFANELLQEGSEIELLQCANLVTRRLDVCHQSNKNTSEMKVSSSFQFLPEELATNLSTPCPLYGIITTQILSIRNCTLHMGGLKNMRAGRKAETILETKDSSGKVIQRGGEKIEAFVKYLNGTNKTLIANVIDNKDGTYKITFVPGTPGKIMLNIFIKGQHIKESPLTLLVRNLRPHRGTFHCCSFCSSGGSKEATCGCGAKMPGDYKGCGHGHDGHPGKSHWSCCGNTLELSECVRSDSLTHYQITI